MTLMGGFLRRTVVDDVVIGLPLRSYSYYEKASAIATLCELQGIVVRFLPGLFNLRLARPRTEEFGDDAMITEFAELAINFRAGNTRLPH